MSTKDETVRLAKSPPHGQSRNDKQFEHDEIIDNRQVWEVLEEVDE